MKEPIIINYSETYTMNLGNYETTRVQFGISYPLENPAHIKKMKEKIIKAVHNVVRKRIQELAAEYKIEPDEIPMEEVDKWR